MTKIKPGTWLRDNSTRHPERYMMVLSRNSAHVKCVAIQDMKIGHGSRADDVKVRRTSVSVWRIHNDGKARKSDYNTVTDVPGWVAAMVANYLNDRKGG